MAARGLDVKDLMHVINYDFPGNIEDFVHRIGRTCRGSSLEGNSWTFFTSSKADRGSAAALVDLMVDAAQEVPQELKVLALQGGGGGSKTNKWRGGRSGGGGRGGGRRW